MSTVHSPRHHPFLQLPQRWLVERRMRGVRERERNKRWRDVIQSDARWPASLPKTVGAARRGVFHPLNYSGTLLKTPTPISPPSIPQTSSSQDAFPRGTRPAIVSGNRTTIAYLAALLYQRRCPIPTADRTDLQGPTRTQPLCHPPYAPESGGGALCYSQTSHARCGYEYRQMRQSGLDRYQLLASDLHGGEEGPTSYTVAGMVYRLECGADCSHCIPGNSLESPMNTRCRACMAVASVGNH